MKKMRLTASQIAPELEENIKEYIQRTMKEAKKEAPRLAKQPSKEEQTSISNTQNQILTNPNHFLQNNNVYPLSKPQTTENLMDIEEEKAPLKPATSGNIGIGIGESKIKEEITQKDLGNGGINRKRNSVNGELEDIRKIENILRCIFL